LLEWIKVTIAMQQRVPFHYAKRRNQTIYSLANRMAALPQSSKILSGRQCQLRAACREYLKSKKIALNSMKGSVVWNPLQDLTKNDVS
jgi:hypothetical protein